MSDPRIVRIDSERIDDAVTHGHAAAIRAADVVITPSGRVVKDRHGVLPRMATAQELALAIPAKEASADG